jgi:zinc transport system permease protein
MTMIMKAIAMTNALFAGLAIALVAGPIGCFIVWRRMAYFGESLAHGGLLGAGLGAVYHFNLVLGAIGTSMAMALILTGLKRQRSIAVDTLIGILSYTALAVGLVSGAIDDHEDALFGDVANVLSNDVLVLWFGAIVACALIIYYWRDLIAISVHEDLARAEGINVALVELVLMLTIAGMTALGMKVIGLMLITALLIIPAAAARRFAKSPEQMAIIATLVATIAVIAGLLISMVWGTVAGPTIVLCASFIFILTLSVKQRN